MERPLLLRMLPQRLRIAAWARLYRRAGRHWSSLYEDATLAFAPHITMQLVPGDIISDCIAFTGVWELSLSRRLMKMGGSGGVMIDIGANLGYFSLLWASAGLHNRCFSFEASPRNEDRLRRNVTRNRLDSQIQIYPVAAGKENGHMEFDLGPPEQTGWGGLSIGAAAHPVTVAVVRVDQVLDRAIEIALLKIDIEGADTWALIGCEQLLRARQVKLIWFEQNKLRMRKLGIALNEAEAFLRSVGYTSQPESDPSQDLVNWSAWPQ